LIEAKYPPTKPALYIVYRKRERTAVQERQKAA
jgi:hypothetical protein